MVSPCTLQEDTGVATSAKPWYANATAHAYANRVTAPMSLTIERSPADCHCLLVNTLYPWYGDAVSLLLRINALRGAGSLPIIVLINRALAWLVPDWVQGVWIVETPFLQNGEWKDGLAHEIKEQATKRRLLLSIPTTFQPFHITPNDLAEFTRIAPFPRERWLERLRERPVVTFQWRTDRVWADVGRSLGGSWFVKSKIALKIWRVLGLKPERAIGLRQQVARVVHVAEGLRSVFPNLEFAVCGEDSSSELPAWIKDLRVARMESDTNRTWAEQAAQSHILFAVHGSHTTLPGSLSGALVELMPDDRWRNILTCPSITVRQVREAILVHRVLPVDVSSESLKNLLIEMLCDYPYFAVAMKDEYYGPLEPSDIADVRSRLAERQRVIAALTENKAAEMMN